MTTLPTSTVDIEPTSEVDSEGRSPDEGGPLPGARQRRRRAKPPQHSSTAGSSAPPRQHYAILCNHDSANDHGLPSSSNVPPAPASAAVTGSLVRIARLPLRPRRSSPPPRGPPPRTPDDGGSLCVYLYEESHRVHLEIDLPSTEPGHDAVCSRLAERLARAGPAAREALVPDDGAAAAARTPEGVPTERVQWLRRVVSRWYFRHFPNGWIAKHGSNSNMVPTGDVERVYAFLVRHSRVQDFIAAFHFNEGDVTFEDGAAREQTRQLQDARLRMVMTVGHEASKDSHADAIICSPAKCLSQCHTTNMLYIFPSLKRIPLISITLHQKEDSTHANTRVVSDPLLRACVKSLLVGRVLLQSETPSKSHTQDRGASTDARLDVKTCLSVSVPRNPPPRDNALQTLAFRVADVQAAGRPAVPSGDARLPALLVVLPSTRILFPSTADDARRPSTVAPSRPSSATRAMPPLPPHAAHAPAPPHRHLAEALRSILLLRTAPSPPPVPRAFLLTGPPGVGKTYAVKSAVATANAWCDSTPAASEAAVRLVSIRGSELMAEGNDATAAQELKRQFQSAQSSCGVADTGVSPSTASAKAVVVFLDEVDALVSSPIVAAMLAALLDAMEHRGDACADGRARTGWEHILLVAATNRVDAVPECLRRPGRLEKEVAVRPPDADERFVLLQTMLGSSRSGADSADDSRIDVDESSLRRIAELCVGYVAADLSALVRTAAILSLRESTGSAHPSLQNRTAITASALSSAMNHVRASCLRDTLRSAPPKTTWDDIAGDTGGAKQKLREAIEWPRTRKAAFTALGLSPPRGVVLHGPPGCAKTTLAKAAAGAAGVAFLSLSPADVYASSYVGEAEGIVRRAFDLARSAAPCVLFFDEIDAIIGGDTEGSDGKHGHGMGRGTSAEARVLSTFLNEMDGVDGSIEDGVLVLGATNRPRTLDAALLRPGRFDRVIYVPPPDELGRKAIFTMEATKWCDALLAHASSDGAREVLGTAASSASVVSEYFDLDLLACDEVSGSMTGAEIVGACRETAVQVMQTLVQRTTAPFPLSYPMAQSLLHLLMKELEASLRKKIPLLSNAQVLEEYTRFEKERQ